jgi:hypothetical protein
MKAKAKDPPARMRRVMEELLDITMVMSCHRKPWAANSERRFAETNDLDAIHWVILVNAHLLQRTPELASVLDPGLPSDAYDHILAGHLRPSEMFRPVILARPAGRLVHPQLCRVRRLSIAGKGNDAESYLLPFPSHPGISALVLNRPQAKNAISMKLLDVS